MQTPLDGLRPWPSQGTARSNTIRASIRLKHQRRRREALLTWLEHQLPERRLRVRGGPPPT